MNRSLTAALVVVVVGIALTIPPAADAQRTPLTSEPACQTLDLASINGVMPRDRNVVVLRWLATSNFEIAYRDNIFLLDAYFDRTPPARPLGFDFTAMKKATAIFIGHAHDDHISDAATVAKQTGAPVYGGPQSYDFVRANGLSDKQAILTKGGETLKFNGVTVQTMLAHHSILGPGFRKSGAPFREIQANLLRPRTEEEQKHEQAINARGSRDQKLAEEGTIAYLFTFDNGYRFYYQDSAGPPTEPQMAFLRTVPSVELASIAYAGYLPQQGIEMAMPLITMVKPRVLIANHHDETGLRFTDMATEPLFEAVRDQLPGTRGFSLLYRSPMCINTSTKEILVGPGPATTGSR